MAQPCTVLIAPSETLEALKARMAPYAGELVAFPIADTLHALEVITTRRAQFVALEREFAASARGAALINRIKADPALARSELRVVALDPREAVDSEPEPAASEPEHLVEVTGTRGARRFVVSAAIELQIDGSPATLVDLSMGGAQVLSPAILKPNQRVRISLSDDRGVVRVTGSVTWATFEIPPRYRAGIEFLDADARSVEAFAERHQQ